MNDEGRIENERDLMHYYRNGELGYSEPEEMYYDRKYNLYFLPNGVVYEARKHYSSDWFKRVVFRFSDHSRCLLIEQDETNTKQEQPTRSRTGRINFVVLGTMSTCSKTSFNDSNRAIVDWADQIDCDFAVVSQERARCMFWNPNLDGHCSCHEAFDDKVGGTVSLDRIDSIKEKDEEREIKNLPIDHHFKEAEETDVQHLSELYDRQEIESLRKGRNPDDSVFYYKEWDTFFDGHGKFLKDMTKERRSKKGNPQWIVDNWSGPLGLAADEQWTNHIVNQLFTDKPNAIDRIDDNGKLDTYLVEDNSGILSPLEMHEALHEIAKIAHSKHPIMWEVDDEHENIIFTDVYLDEKKK